jgi:hypothetical protein
MKLKAIYLLAIFVLLAACSPQVTVTLPPPPTETLVPTPTVHPQFLEWQESIAALSERFALMPDGSIQDNGMPVPGVRVSPDGVMTLTLADGTEMTFDSSDVSFDDEKGFGAEGYKLNDNGEWVEAESKAMQRANELVETYKLADKVTVTEEGDLVKVVDNETGKVLIETDGSLGDKYGLEPESRFDIEFATETIAKNRCESRPEFKPTKNGLMHAETSPPYFMDDVSKMIKELNYPISEGARAETLLIKRDDSCWGKVINYKDLLYRDSAGVAHWLRLITMTKEEFVKFQTSR